MKCSKCGMQLINEEIMFCPKCGSRVNSSVHEVCQEGIYKEELGFSRHDTEYIKPEILKQGNLLSGGLDDDGKNDKAKKTSKAKFLLAFAPVLAAVLLILIFVFKPVDHKAYQAITNEAIEVYSDAMNHNTLIFNTRGKILHQLNKLVAPAYNLDRTAAILYTGSDDINNYGVHLYYADGTNLIEIEHIVSDFDISNDGNYLIYSTQSSEEGNVLYQYDVKRKKETVLAQSSDKQYKLIKFSPDGKSITYNTIQTELKDNTQNITVEGFLIKDGEEPVSLGEGYIALAVSDHATYQYYFDYEDNVINSLYVAKGNRSDEVFTNVVNNYMFFNKDYSEVLFTLEDETYLRTGSGKNIQVADARVKEFILPINSSEYLDIFTPNFRYYNFDTFISKVFLCEDYSLWIIDKEEEPRKIGTAYQANDVAISENGNQLLYLNPERKVMRISDLTGQGVEEAYISNANSFIASGDLSEVYYLDSDQLYYKKGDSEPKQVADNVSSLYWNTDQTQALFEADKQSSKSVLYSSSHGEEPEVVLDYGNHIIQKLNYGVSVETMTNAGYEVYYNTDGNQLKQIVDNMDNNE